MPDRPVLLFDGHCRFCRLWIDYWTKLTGASIEYASSQEARQDYSQIAPAEFSRSVQLVLPDGRVLRGAHAVFETLRHSPTHRWLLWLYERIPLFAFLAERFYALIAAHRNAAYWVTRIFFGIPVQPACSTVIEWIFVRLLGAIYFGAFCSFGVQISGLIGSRGILPVANFLPAVRQSLGWSGYWQVPTIFWFYSGDLFLKISCAAGALLSLLLILGFARRLCLVALFLLYLSLCSAGQDFMSFQWDMLLLESGFLAIFLGSSSLIVWLYRLLLFRLMFLSGAVKLLSHDPAWRTLDALQFHFWTQPLPTPLAWYVNQMPVWFLHFSTASVFAIELGAPWLIFLPRRPRLLAAAAFTLLQITIFLTGNYTFFNLLTIALCLFLLDDQALPRRFHPSAPQPRTGPRVAIPAFLVIAGLGVLQLANTLFGAVPAPAREMLRLVSPLGIVNSYGLFAVMTATRSEIIVQGSNDGSHWLDYEFRYKPGDLRRAPAWVAPHQPRLDWQMWFAALSNWRSNPWFASFMVQLLQGSPPVLELLQTNPFPSHPPRYIRAWSFPYRFTTSRQRLASGAWWQRTPGSPYFPAISLQDVQPQRVP